MYKIFHDNIKLFSLSIGYFNLLRSFYYGAGGADDKNYIITDKIVKQFKSFCKTTIQEIDELLDKPNCKTKLSSEDLKEIQKLIKSIPNTASQGIMREIDDSISKIIKFIDFLINDFPYKYINQVDLREIKTAVNVFKYQIYL